MIPTIINKLLEILLTYTIINRDIKSIHHQCANIERPFSFVYGFRQC